MVCRASLSLAGNELRCWLDTTEKLWIQVLEAKTLGYNQTIGGSGVVGWHCDPLAKLLHSCGRKHERKRLTGVAYWAALPGQQFKVKRPVGAAYWKSRKRLVVTSSGKVQWGL